MCESPRLRFCTNLGGSYQKCSPRVERVSSSESQLSFVDEFGSGGSFNSEGFSSSGEARIGVKIHSIHPYRFQLEQEVQRLQQKLHEEMELHAALESAVGHAAMTFSHLSSLPYDAENLLCNISMLEFTVSKLEEEMVSLHFQLSQERNERRLVEYRLKQSPSQSLLCSLNSTPCSATLRGLEQSMSQLHYATEEVSCQESRDPDSESSSRTRPCSETLNAGCSDMLLQDQKIPTKVLQHVAVGKQSKWKSVKGLWNRPNRLSEEMVRCMKNIFICLSDSSTTGSSKLSPLEGLWSPVSPHGHISRSSSSFSEPSTSLPQAQSPRVEFQRNSNVLAADNTFDPYKVCGKLSWGNIGSYSLAIEVSLMSVGKKQLKYASGILQRFRLLVEQLAKVNPVHLSYDEKLAFWINLYNALIMHAYLAYGVPRSDLKLFSLMQKAAYTVGGHSFNATAIEYVILKLKPPAHRPQSALLLALHKLKMSDEQMKYSIDTCEPLVAFALSCGMYSSPAVRIYTAGNVREELLEAQRDFIRASFAVSSKGKLLVPKMLHCFAKGFINEDAALAVWISQFLPPQQAALVDYCMAQRRQKRLGARNCVVLPFDSRFRYLFLPENRL